MEKTEYHILSMGPISVNIFDVWKTLGQLATKEKPTRAKIEASLSNSFFYVGKHPSDCQRRWEKPNIMF